MSDIVNIYGLCFKENKNTVFYVGQTIDKLENRLYSHKRSCLRKKHSYSFFNQIENINDITIFLLAKCHKIDALNIEHDFWKMLKCNDFNIINRDPMFAFPNKRKRGFKQSQATKDKIGKANHYKRTKEHSRKISIALTGKKLTEEVKKKISDKLKNRVTKRVHSQEARKRISGENNHHAKLTNEEVIRIRYLYEQEKLKIFQIAKIFNHVSLGAIRRVLFYLTWKNVK